MGCGNSRTVGPHQSQSYDPQQDVDDVDNYQSSEKYDWDRANDQDRLGFVRKVYGILATQLVITACFVYLCMSEVQASIAANKPTAFTSVLFNGGNMIAVMVLYLVSYCALICYRKTVPTNYILLGVFTMCVSWMVGFICSLSNPKTVMEATVLTAGMTVAISFYAMTTKTDFTNSIFSFALVVVNLSAMILCIPLMWIFHSPLLRTVYCALGVMLFGFYLLFDTQTIMGGQHKYC